jgi:hypothetical protein
MVDAMYYAASIAKNRGTFDVGIYEDEIKAYLEEKKKEIPGKEN